MYIAQLFFLRPNWNYNFFDNVQIIMQICIYLFINFFTFYFYIHFLLFFAPINFW